MASAELSRRVEKVVGYPPLCDMGELQRREFHLALLDAGGFEDLRLRRPAREVAGGDSGGGAEPAAIPDHSGEDPPGRRLIGGAQMTRLCTSIGTLHGRPPRGAPARCMRGALPRVW
jgi:hypothetical protein